MTNARRSDEFIRSVGRAIGAIRRERQWTQAQLAERLGRSTKYVTKLESGVTDLRLSTVHQVARALDVTPGTLVDHRALQENAPGLRRRGALYGFQRSGWRKVPTGTPHAIPVLDLQPRAGRPHSAPEPLRVAWALPPEGRHVREDGLFLAQVLGDSMSPQIKDGAWCLFSRNLTEREWLGQRVLIRQTDAAGFSSWLVKRISSVALPDDAHMVLQLVSHNPSYEPMTVTLDGRGETGIEAVVREILLES